MFSETLSVLIEVKICHLLLLFHSQTIFLLKEKINWLASFCSSQIYIDRYLFHCCRKEKKTRVGIVFLQNFPRTETNWTSLLFLISSFFHLFKTGTGFFCFLIILELQLFSKSSEKILMAVRGFQLIL